MQDTDRLKLTEFVEASKKQGASDEFLASFLTRRGWSENDVYAVLGGYWEQATGVTVPDRASRGESSRDAFLYLLSFTTLATWTGALGSLLFRFIEHWFPDPVTLQRIYNLRAATTWQMASIAVAFPVFLGVMYTILREAQNRPERLESSVRKWLTYIALLLTASTMICDLIWFLDYFLSGELTVRFVLKAATVMAICGSIFFYYLRSLRWDRNADLSEVKQRSAKFAAGAAASVILAFCTGLFVAGTPSAQRHLEADRKRVQDLRAIASSINAWQQRARVAQSPQTLPLKLSDLVGTGINASQLTDPETKAPYIYSVKAAPVYRLCATFSGPEPEEEAGRRQIWHHGAGLTCFTLDASSSLTWY